MGLYYFTIVYSFISLNESSVSYLKNIIRNSCPWRVNSWDKLKFEIHFCTLVLVGAIYKTGRYANRIFHELPCMLNIFWRQLESFRIFGLSLEGSGPSRSRSVKWGVLGWAFLHPQFAWRGWAFLLKDFGLSFGLPRYLDEWLPEVLYGWLLKGKARILRKFAAWAF